MAEGCENLPIASLIRKETDDDQGARIDDSRQDFRALEAKRVFEGTRLLAQPYCYVADDDGDPIAEIMNRIGEERKTPGNNPTNNFKDGDEKVQHHGHKEVFRQFAVGKDLRMMMCHLIVRSRKMCILCGM